MPNQYLSCTDLSGAYLGTLTLRKKYGPPLRFRPEWSNGQTEGQVTEDNQTNNVGQIKIWSVTTAHVDMKFAPKVTLNQFAPPEVAQLAVRL